MGPKFAQPFSIHRWCSLYKCCYASKMDRMTCKKGTEEQIEHVLYDFWSSAAILVNIVGFEDRLFKGNASAYLLLDLLQSQSINIGRSFTFWLTKDCLGIWIGVCLVANIAEIVLYETIYELAIVSSTSLVVLEIVILVGCQFVQHHSILNTSIHHDQAFQDKNPLFSLVASLQWLQKDPECLLSPGLLFFRFLSKLVKDAFMYLWLLLMMSGSLGADWSP